MCMCSIFIIQQEHILQDILTYRHITEKSKKKWDWKNESYLGCLSLSLVKYFSRKTWTARNFSMWNQTTYSPQWDRRCTAKLSSIGFNSGCVFFFLGSNLTCNHETNVPGISRSCRRFAWCFAFEVRALPKAPSKKAGFGEMSYPPRVVDFSKFFCFFSVSFLFPTGNDSRDCSVWNLQTIPTANFQKLSLSFVAVVLLKH